MHRCRCLGQCLGFTTSTSEDRCSNPITNPVDGDPFGIYCDECRQRIMKRYS